MFNCQYKKVVLFTSQTFCCKVSHIVHGVIVFFHRCVLSCLIVPAVKIYLTKRITTPAVYPYPAVLYAVRHKPDTRNNVVLCRLNSVFSVPAYALYERSRRGVANDLFDAKPVGKLFKPLVMLLVSLLLTFTSRIIVILPEPVPYSTTLAPKPEA